ncbi:MAG: hypothetical protein KDC38_01895 [Planctomycetes bacterium]|nr:hypothetical protein [Planctomycetota bacterium]
MTAPLDRDQLSRVEQIGARLQAQFGSVLRALPGGTRTVRGLSATLDVDRNTCHRLLAACTPTLLPAEVIERAPGRAGLRQVVEALRRIGSDSTVLRALDVTLDQFDALLREVGSHRRLVTRLRATRHQGARHEEPSATIDARRRRFEADCELIGTHHQAQIRIVIFRRLPHDLDQLEAVLVVGSLGTTAQASGMPLLLHVSRRPQQGTPLTSLDGTPIGATLDHAILADFSTSPVPPISAVEQGNNVLQIIEPGALRGTGGVDLVLGLRYTPFSPHPRRLETPILSHQSRLRTPSRYLLQEVYLERELSRQSVPNVGMFLTGDEPFISFAQQWPNRLPVQPTLELLPEPSAMSGCPWYPRHVELVGRVFETIGWSLGDYVGHRVAQPFPVIGVNTIIGFEFDEAS